MPKKLKMATEGGGIARSYHIPEGTLFPTLGMATLVKDGRRVRMSDEQLLGPKWWGKLQVALEARQTPEAIMKRANELIISTEAIILEKTGYPIDGAFSHAIDGGETRPGTHRKVMDGNRPAFSNVFMERWTNPQGVDLTIKDENLILDPSLREPNFGVPTKKKTTTPGVV